MLLSELVQSYVDSTATIRSTHTEKLFAIVVKHFTAHVGGCGRVNDLTDINLTSYMRARRAIGRAEATVENEAVKILVLWRWAASRGLAAHPNIRVERQRPETPRALMKPQIRALFSAAKRAEGTIATFPRAVYFTALLWLIWETGERITAVRSLKLRDIDLQSRCVTYRTRKGKARVITRPISRYTARAIKKWLSINPSEEPFAVVGLTSIYYHLDRILVDAGIPVDKRNKFHALRRSHASYLHVAGGDATESLDHSDERVTRAHYLDPRIIAKKSGFSLLFNPLGIRDRLLSWIGW